MGEISDVSSFSAFSTRLRNADGEPIVHGISPAFPVLVVSGDVTLVLATRMSELRWLSEYLPSEVPGLEGLLEVLALVDFDAFAADVEDEGDRILSDLTDGPVLD